jgi:hypothetical protein
VYQNPLNINTLQTQFPQAVTVQPEGTKDSQRARLTLEHINVARNRHCIMSLFTISDGTFTKTIDTSKKVRSSTKKAAPRYWRKGKQERADYLASRKKGTKPTGKISTTTRERLYLEAESSPAFYGMEREDIRLYIDTKINAFLSHQPWWYGHTPGADARHHANQRAYAARRTDPSLPMIETTEDVCSTL